MSQEHEAQLTLKDRLNFPYILANQILTFQKALLAQEFSEREIRETIEGFIHLIPDDWKDDTFNKALKKSKETRKNDVRPIVTGTVRMSAKACEEMGIPAFVDEEVSNYYAIFQECMNLLSRKKLLSKILRVEQLESIDFDTATTEDEVQQGNVPSE